MKQGKIYHLSYPNGKIFYVGRTFGDLKRRLKAHIQEASEWASKTINPEKIKHIKMCNYSPVITEIESLKCDVKLLSVREKYWINYYLLKGCELSNISCVSDFKKGKVKLVEDPPGSINTVAYCDIDLKIGEILVKRGHPPATISFIKNAYPDRVHKMRPQSGFSTWIKRIS